MQTQRLSDIWPWQLPKLHAMENQPALSHERLDVYRCAIEFLAIVHRIIKAMPGGYADLREQLKDAATSIVLNIAEGAGKTTAPDKRKHYTIARGSALESAGALDACRVLELADVKLLRDGRALLVRIVGMLTKMTR
jgi:four helix bundle protein